MPIEYLAPMVLFGLIVLVGAVHLAGGSQPLLLRSADEVIRRFCVDFPHERPGDAIISPDGQAAIVLSKSGEPKGLVAVMGHFLVTRHFDHCQVTGLAVKSSCVVVSLGDVTLPSVGFEFEGNEADRLSEKLRALVPGGEETNA